MSSSCAAYRLFGQALILCLLPLNSYGNFGGVLDPTTNVGAPAMVEIEKPNIGPLDGGFVEYGIFAAEKALRNVSASTPLVSGRTIPNTTVLENLSAPGATCQWAWDRTCEIWIVKYSASGSPSEYRRFTDPGLAARIFSNSDALSAGKTRQATTSFSFSVSSRAVAASFSSSAARKTAFPAVFPASIPSLFASATWLATPNLYCSKARLASTASCFCSFITTKVETTTITAANAPNPKNTNMMLFQVSREKPSIRLTFLEKVVFSVCAISCVGLLTIVVLSITNLFKPHCPSKIRGQYPIHVSRVQDWARLGRLFAEEHEHFTEDTEATEVDSREGPAGTDAGQFTLPRAPNHCRVRIREFMAFAISRLRRSRNLSNISGFHKSRSSGMKCAFLICFVVSFSRYCQGEIFPI